LFIYFSLTDSVFFTVQNLRNLLTDSSVLWVVSIGMTFVLLTGGVDLSVGAVGAVTTVFIAKLLNLGIPAGVVIIVGCLLGVVLGGVINGLLVGRLKLSFFVVTLATLIAFGGVASIWSNDQSQFISNRAILNIGAGNLAGLPTPLWIMIVTLAVGLYVLHRTFFGRDIYAVGGSLPAARLSGVRTTRTVVSVYAISGLCAAFAGIILAGRLGSTEPVPDGTLPLQAAAAVLLGGTSLLGGSGGLGGTAFGVLFLAVLTNGLNIAGVQSFWQQVITGVILILAVLGDRVAVTGGLRWRSFARRGPSQADGSAPSTDQRK
jgi:ribose transport system permease protein